MDRKILLGAADLGRWQSEEFVRAVLISDVFHSKVQQGARTTLSASSQNLFTLGGGGWWHLCFLELCFAAGSLTLPQRRMTCPPPAAAHTYACHIRCRAPATAAPKLDLRICFPLDTS